MVAHYIILAFMAGMFFGMLVAKKLNEEADISKKLLKLCPKCKGEKILVENSIFFNIFYFFYNRKKLSPAKFVCKNCHREVEGGTSLNKKPFKFVLKYKG